MSQAKSHIVFDVFSRLLSKNSLIKVISLKCNKLDIFYTFHLNFIEIGEFPAIKICKEYNNNLVWNKKKKVLEEN